MPLVLDFMTDWSVILSFIKWHLNIAALAVQRYIYVCHAPVAKQVMIYSVPQRSSGFPRVSMSKFKNSSIYWLMTPVSALLSGARCRGRGCSSAWSSWRRWSPCRPACSIGTTTSPPQVPAWLDCLKWLYCILLDEKCNVSSYDIKIEKQKRQTL